jgi:hypothetical protein
MTNLSSVAQAVLIAQARQRCLSEWSNVNDPPCHPDDFDWNGCGQCISCPEAAAALKAAVSEACPEQHIKDIDYVHQAYVDGWKDVLDLILSIADELEGSQQ